MIAEATETVLEVRGLSKVYGDHNEQSFSQTGLTKALTSALRQSSGRLC